MQALYSAENLLVDSMPRMVENTQNEELRKAFTVHLQETQQQIQRLEQAAQILGVDPNGEENVALQGLIAEGEKLMQKDASPEVLDAALIAAAQKIEHYEIAGYGTAAYLAEELGYTEVAQLLQQTLQEEKKTDVLLNEIAKNSVNRRAEQA
ncbi:ferritin-like domain-containing protein [Hymenobacter volaticus]|uniref:Ferritin-like domain-containing protein n=2 Tax=Hymenobacter volaticus TaxID=2932254 RepID=A0ABY4G4Z5_9BACT|nr:ferritin-like domain-containing protein [Hymenobacter volaticus]